MNRTTATTGAISSRSTDELTHEERAVLAAIRDTSYGAVEVVMHQARIVQIVKTEKLRLEPAPTSP
jgi:hypothetical protein